VGEDRVVVAGHDFGGPVAAHLLAAAPERVAALGLFATNAFPDTPIPFPLSVVNLPVVGPLAGGVLFSRPSLTMMVRRGVGRPRMRLARERYVGDRRRRSAIATIFSQSLRRLGELYGPVEAALAAVAVPAVVGWGDRDPFFPLAIGERTAALVPDARFRCYHGAGHFLPEERPVDVAADLLALAAVVDGHRR
jgi:pimeloyl-ACP methyl ester carboxylesterase